MPPENFSMQRLHALASRGVAVSHDSNDGSIYHLERAVGSLLPGRNVLDTFSFSSMILFQFPFLHVLLLLHFFQLWRSCRSFPCSEGIQNLAKG